MYGKDTLIMFYLFLDNISMNLINIIFLSLIIYNIDRETNNINMDNNYRVIS